jgi:uncharacterized membrane protein
MVLLMLGTVAFLLLQYPDLPWLLPVHFRMGGIPNGWQYKTLGRVMMPAFVQSALMVTFGSIAALLRPERVYL